MRRILWLFVFFFLLLAGCEQPVSEVPGQGKSTHDVSPGVIKQAGVLLHDPLGAALVESPAEAIPEWRQDLGSKPALLLFSQNPFLAPIPDAVRSAALDLGRSGHRDDFRRWVGNRLADPLLLPEMSLSLALAGELFSELIWVLPQGALDEHITIDRFRETLVETGTASAEEASAFMVSGNEFHGTLRQIPVRVVPHRQLQSLAGPVFVHFDLSFFKALYVNEIKTPLYPLVHQLLDELGEHRVRTLGVSISLGSLSGATSLQVRFVGDLLARRLANPKVLGEALSGNDALRHEALYLANFFQKERRLELIRRMDTAASGDAAVKYDLFHAYAENKQGNNALAALAEAVALDPVYAGEYLDLAEQALEKNRPDAALRMLDLAVAAMPDNPFIAIRKAEILLQTGHGEALGPVLDRLMQLPWSELYYPNIKTRLQERLLPVPSATP